MKHRYWVFSLTIAFIAGCSFTPKDSSPTLKSLETRNVQVNTSTPVTPNLEKAKQSYETILAGSTDSELRRRAMRRLADLELQDPSQPVATKSQDSPSAQTLSEPNLQKAITLYESLLQSFPDKADNDRVYYQLARAYEESGDMDKSFETLGSLVSKFPQSTYYDEAQFRRGEISFALQDYAAAEDAYRAALREGKASPYFERATYKLGWAVYKQEHYLDAVGYFLALIDLKLSGNRLSSNIDDFDFLSRGDIELIKDAFRVSSLAFSALDGSSSVQAYFKDKPNTNYEFLVYRSLGDYYIKHERYLDAANTYAQFGAQRPEHPQGILLMIDAIELFQQRGTADQVLQSKVAIANRYSAYLNRWSGNSHYGFEEYLMRSDSKLERHLNDYVMNTVEELGRYYHARAQKNSNPQDYQDAIKWYQSFVLAFMDSPKTTEINFLLAEALFEDSRYAEAIREYEKTAYNYNRHKNSAEAGYAALVAYDKYKAFLKDEELDIWDHLSIQSAQRFSKLFPKDPRTPDVLAKVIDNALEKKQYVQVISFAKRLLVVTTASQTQYRQKATLAMATAYFDEGSYEEAESAYSNALKEMSPTDGNRQATEDHLAVAIYKQGEAAKEQGDMDSSTQHFLRLGAVLPKSSFRANAEYDAATNMIAAKKWDAVIPILEKLKADFPNHDLIGDVENNLAVAYLETGNNVKAADQLIVLSKNHMDPTMKRDAIWQSAELFEKGDALDKAIESYKTYIASYPDEFEQSVEARQRIIDLYGKLKSPADQTEWRQKLVAAVPANGSYGDRTRYLAASAALTLAKPTYSAFSAIKLVAPLKQNITGKRTAMEAALKAYGTASQYGVAEITTESTFYIGELYRNFSKELLDSERPEGLSDEALEQYELVLEDQAYPLEEKAIEIHEANTARIKDNLYDEWIKGSFASLGKLLPARYGKFESSTQVVHEIN